MDAESAHEWEGMVEAVRVGTVFAHDAKQYGKWRARKPRRLGSPLSDAALEAAIRRVGDMFPDHVTTGRAAA